MEIAIPIIALGGLFAIKRRKEKFTGMGRNTNYLPNVNELPNNFPVVNENQIKDSVNSYPNPNAATDKYFNQTLYQDAANAIPNNVGNNISQVYSLTGNYMNTSEFKHENMVPFYRSKMGTNTGVKDNESLLDNMVGTYNNMIKKTEQAPLFKPENNINWVNGMPSMDDFYASRVNPGMSMNNVKPFESIMVAPGLNKGFDNTGSGGFNSGMESRETWMDKNVDELRVETNPKMTYTLENLEGPKKSLVSNLGIQAPVNKNLPDSYFAMGPERYFTGPNESKAPMYHSEEMVKDQHRADTTTEYSGNPTSLVKQSGYVTKNYQPSTKIALPTSDVAVSSAKGRGGYEGFNSMHKSHTNYVNNRAVNQQPQTLLLNVKQTIGSILAPITEILKPNKRDELTNNPRIYGNGKYGVNSSYVSTHKVEPTIKETTIYTPNSFQGQQNGVGGYATHDKRPINNQRHDTSYSSFGNVGGASNTLGLKDYSAVYNQTNNELKEPTTYARANHGNTQVFNSHINMSSAKMDQDRVNNRQWVPSSMPATHAHVEMLGQTYKPKEKQTNIDDRLNGDLLSAFKANPYTQSLQSF